MTLEFFKIFQILIIGLIIYFTNNKVRQLYSRRFDNHQKFSSDILGNPVGGYIIFLFIYIFNFYSNYLEIFFLFLIFLSGILSDNKLFNSPKKRLFFQIFLILFFVFFSELEILSSRIDLIDKVLEYKFFNIIFTTFCILIVINGSNFIDGLNGLVLGYYLMIVTLLINSNADLNIYFEKALLLNFVFILLILLIINFLNVIFLGDNGSYLIGFLVAIYLIKLHQININLSPYFIILLLWYPCFENLFSIFRKKISKIKATEPDNNHLHQLLFLFLSNKLRIKKKLLANNVSSLIINFYHLPIFLIAFQKIEKTNIQLFLIAFNLLIYIFIYILLLKYKKNNN